MARPRRQVSIASTICTLALSAFLMLSVSQASANHQPWKTCGDLGIYEVVINPSNKNVIYGLGVKHANCSTARRVARHLIRQASEGPARYLGFRCRFTSYVVSCTGKGARRIRWYKSPNFE